MNWKYPVSKAILNDSKYMKFGKANHRAKISGVYGSLDLRKKILIGTYEIICGDNYDIMHLSKPNEL